MAPPKDSAEVIKWAFVNVENEKGLFILRTRKITVEDFSNKWSMGLLRDIQEETYKRALEILSSVQLEKIVRDLSDMEECEELKKIIDGYKHRSESILVTIKDLLNFMLTVKAISPVQRKPQLPNATRECYWDKPKLLASVIRHMNDRLQMLLCTY